MDVGIAAVFFELPFVADGPRVAGRMARTTISTARARLCTPWRISSRFAAVRTTPGWRNGCDIAGFAGKEGIVIPGIAAGVGSCFSISDCANARRFVASCGTCAVIEHAHLHGFRVDPHDFGLHSNRSCHGATGLERELCRLQKRQFLWCAILVLKHPRDRINGSRCRHRSGARFGTRRSCWRGCRYRSRSRRWRGCGLFLSVQSINKALPNLLRRFVILEHRKPKAAYDQQNNQPAQYLDE